MAEHAHPAAHADATAHQSGHPTTGKYVQIFFVLFLLTALEVGALYVPGIKPVLPFLLIGLAAVKFATVAAFYMHLKFDNWLFTAFFVGGIALAISVALAFSALFGTFTQAPVSHGASPGEQGTTAPTGH